MDNKEPTQTIHDEVTASKAEHHNPTGTVTLLEDGEIILIPTPSPDPRGKGSRIHVHECFSDFDSNIARST
jgi:hypothetical protein